MKSVQSNSAPDILHHFLDHSEDLYLGIVVVMADVALDSLHNIQLGHVGIRHTFDDVVLLFLSGVLLVLVRQEIRCVGLLKERVALVLLLERMEKTMLGLQTSLFIGIFAPIP